MSEKNSGFVFLKSYYEALKNLPDDLRLQLYDAIIAYGLGDEIADFDGINECVANAIFTLIKPTLDASRKRYETNVNNGAKGGRKITKEETQEEPNKNPELTQAEPNCNPSGTQQEPKANPTVTQVEPNKNPELTQAEPKPYLEKEKEKEYEKEYEYEKELEKELQKEKPKEKESTSNDVTLNSHKKFVKPKLEEVKAYCFERKNNVDPQKFYDHYESVGWKVGKSAMKDWRACVRTWEHNDYGQTKKVEMSMPEYMKRQQNGEIKRGETASMAEIELLRAKVKGMSLNGKV